MIIPPYLNIGDTIAIAAPARSISLEQLELFKLYVESKGYKIFIHESLTVTENQFGGSDMHRGELFNDLLGNPTIKAIWCARGGYGCLRMVDFIDFDLLKKSPKWIIGFSDISILHSHVLQNCNTSVIHGTMPIFMHGKTGSDYEEVREAVDSVLNLISGKPASYNLTQNEILNSSSNFVGSIVGGNLSVLASIAGSQSEVDFTKKILFLEDLDEYFYHIDRLFLMFKRSGKLSKLKALFVGSFTSMRDHQTPFGKNVKDIISEHCANYGYPIVFDIDSGHHLHNMAIPLGSNVSFQNGILTFATA